MEIAKLEPLAALGENGCVGELEEAAQSDVLLFSVYWLRMEQVLSRLGSLEARFSLTQ